MCKKQIDIHTHILPKKLPDLSKKFGYDGWISLRDTPDGKEMYLNNSKFRDVQQNCYVPTERISTGNIQVLSTVPVLFNYWAKPKHTLELAQYLNDDIAQTCMEHPQNFIGLGTLPMQDPELAIQELLRCINELGLAGVQIGSHINEWNLDAKELDPFWKTCNDLKVPVFIHPWDMQQTGRMEKYWFPWLIGMPCETTMAICSLIFGGVYEKYPDLKVSRD